MSFLEYVSGSLTLGMNHFVHLSDRGEILSAWPVTLLCQPSLTLNGRRSTSQGATRMSGVALFLAGRMLMWKWSRSEAILVPDANFSLEMGPFRIQSENQVVTVFDGESDVLEIYLTEGDFRYGGSLFSKVQGSETFQEVLRRIEQERMGVVPPVLLRDSRQSV